MYNITSHKIQKNNAKTLQSLYSHGHDRERLILSLDLNAEKVRDDVTSGSRLFPVFHTQLKIITILKKIFNQIFKFK